MPNILLNGHVSSQLKEILLKLLDSTWHICVWDSKINSVEEFYEYCLETDILVGGSIPTPLMPNFKSLKLFQIPWAGYEFCTPETVPKGIPVCNCYEHETAIAEYVLSGIPLSGSTFVRLSGFVINQSSLGKSPPINLQ